MAEPPNTISGLADCVEVRSSEDDMSSSSNVSSHSLKRPLLSDERRLINRRLVTSVIMAQEKNIGTAPATGSQKVTEIRFVTQNKVRARKNNIPSRYSTRMRRVVESRGRERALYAVRKSTESSKMVGLAKLATIVGPVFVTTHAWASALYPMVGPKIITVAVTVVMELRVHKANIMLSTSTTRGDLSHRTTTRRNASKFAVSVEKIP